MIVGITGPKRAGKSTVARFLVEYHGFEELSFAQRLKDMAYAVNPIVVVEQEGISEQHFRLQQAVDQLGWEGAKDEFPEVRRFLQYLGTEGVRGQFGENAWVRKVAEDFDKLAGKTPFDERIPHVVIADVRFDNEADFIRDRGGVILGVERPGYGTGDVHESENGVLPDWYIGNDGDGADLYSEVTRVLLSVFSQKVT